MLKKDIKGGWREKMIYKNNDMKSGGWWTQSGVHFWLEY